MDQRVGLMSLPRHSVLLAAHVCRWLSINLIEPSQRRLAFMRLQRGVIKKKPELVPQLRLRITDTCD
jgi:hypothetical protein